MNYPAYHPNEYLPSGGGGGGGQRDRALDQRELHQTMGPKKGQQVLKQGGPYQAFSEEDEEEEEETDPDGHTDEMMDEEEVDEYGNPLPPHARHHRQYPPHPGHHHHHEHHEGEEEGEYEDDEDPDMHYDPQHPEEQHRNIYQEADLDGHGHPGGVTPGLGPLEHSQRNSALQAPLIPPPQSRAPGASTQGPPPTSTGGGASAATGQDPYRDQYDGDGRGQAQQRSRRPSMGRPGLRGAPMNPTVPQPLGAAPPQQQQPFPQQHQQQQAAMARQQQQQQPPNSRTGQAGGGGGPADEQNDMVRRYLASMHNEGALPPDMVDIRSRGTSPGPGQLPIQQPQQNYGATQQQQQKAFHPLPPVPQPAPAPIPPQQQQEYTTSQSGSGGVQFPRQERQPVPQQPSHQQYSAVAPSGTGSSGVGAGGVGSVTSPTVGGVTSSRAPAGGPPKTNASRAVGGLVGADPRASRTSTASVAGGREGEGGHRNNNVSFPPGSNRARIGNSGGSAPMLPLAAAGQGGGAGGGAGGAGGGSRKRRVSDGSATGALRKDMLLSKMAEALKTEREKAALYQKEFNEAEREVRRPGLARSGSER